MMRITVDIEDSKIRAIQKWTNQRKKSPALAQALGEHIEQREREEFLAQIKEGKSDYQSTNDKVEALAHEQP